jgi:uncharacterized phage protein gp47/JayE
MADSFTSSGLTVATLDELVTQLENDFKTIYGDDINIESNSPDGQLLNIFAQGGSDIREILKQTYDSFDPDNTSGRILDERCAINNVYRKGGTRTTVNITIVTDRAVHLDGASEDFQSGYTIQDDAGTKFLLSNSVDLQAGTHTDIEFQSQEIGAVETTPNTITTPVTVVLGVISVNNPTAGTTGVNEETDAQLKIRRRQSLSIGSTGYLNGLQASLSQLEGMVDVKVYENETNSTVDTIPAHSIWVVVDGGTASDIADTIFKKRSAGCGMKGSQSYTILTPSGQNFVAKWDNKITKALSIKFNIQKTLATATFDTDVIAQYIADNLSFGIGEGANTSDVTTLAQEAINVNGGNGVALNVLISDDGGTTWVEYIAPTIATKIVAAKSDITPTVL